MQFSSSANKDGGPGLSFRNTLPYPALAPQEGVRHLTLDWIPYWRRNPIKNIT